MQFKRWRVVARQRLVNAGAAASVLFLAACGGPAGDGAGEAGDEVAVPEVPVADRGLVLPAVWSTRALDGAIADVALSGGARPLLAVAFEGRGFQLFNLEGERLGEPIGFGVTDLAGGHFADIDGAAVTVFPGVGRDGSLNAYLHGDNLQAPVELDLPIETGGEAALGVCSGPVDGASGGSVDGAIMRLGYWVEGAEQALVSGTLAVEGGEFRWTAEETLEAASPLAACRITGDAPEAVVGNPVAAAALERPEGRYAVTLTDAGQLLAARPGGEGPEVVTLREGLSVRVPIPPVAMDALGAPRDGGYPYGMIVLAGETAPGVHQAVFVDTTPLVEAGDGEAGTAAGE